MNEATRPYIESEDPHALGLPGLAIEVISGAILSRHESFVRDWRLDYWVRMAYPGVDPEEIRRGILKRWEME